MNLLIRLRAFFILTGLGGVVASAQTPPVVEWTRALKLATGASPDVAASAIQDTAGNTYIAGRTRSLANGFDFYTVKFTASGGVAWARQYDGPDHGDDQGKALAVDDAGNVYVTGVSPGATTGNDYATVKYDAQGTEVWVRRYDGTASASDIPAAMVIDSLGRVIVTGQSLSNGASIDYATLAYSAAGDLLWTARYNGPSSGADRPLALAADTAGNVLVTGASPGTNVGDDYATIKYDSAGAQQWVARYNGPGNGTDSANAIALDASGNIYVTGGSIGSAVGSDFATVKYSPTGTQLWAARYNGTANNLDQGNALSLDAAGNVFVTGTSVPTGLSTQVTTIRYDASGAEQWVTTSGNGVGYKVAVGADGSVHVTGTNATSSFSSFGDVSTAKIAANGAQQWVRSFNGSINGPEQGLGLWIDPGTGNVTVAGTLQDNGTSAQFGVLKYNNAGTQTLVARQGGEGNGNDANRASVTDAAGNTYITGRAFFAGQADNWLTAKYDPSGELLWTANYNGPGNGSDIPAAMALDAAGNLYVTGSSSGPTGTVCTTIKYAPAGIEMWVARYTPAGTTFSTGVAIVAGKSGEIYVGGNATATGSSQDMLTLKYDTAGSLLWDRRYNGPANASDSTAAISLSPAGDFVITAGSSPGSGTSGDLTALKQSADGALVWAGRYNGPGNGSDNANAALIDATGDVYACGASTGSATGVDFTVVKFATDGSVAWAARQSFSSAISEAATELLLDFEGNIVVGGVAAGTSSNVIAVAKYSPAGQELWFTRHTAPTAITFSTLAAMALDSAGNVYAAGNAAGIGTLSNDVVLIKFATTGVQEWTLFRDLGGTSIDIPVGLCLDAANNFYVTGTTTPQIDTSGASDMFVLKASSAAAPVISMGAADGITAETAILHASIQPNSSETEVTFHYGRTAGYGSTVAGTPSTINGSGTVSVSASLAGLLPHTVYHYRAEATNRLGRVFGQDVTFTTANRLPVAANDSFHRTLDSLGTLPVLENDTDPDNDVLTITATTPGAAGTTSIQSGRIAYVPHPVFDGNDTFTYSVADGFGGTATGTVTLTNALPAAANHALHPAHGPGGSTVIDTTPLLSDPDGDSPFISTVSQGAHGTVSFSGNILTYTAGPSFTGTDAFGYTIRDGAGGGAKGRVTLGNAAPAAVNDSFIIGAGAVPLAVLANDSDPDGDTLVITAVSTPGFGTAAIVGGGITYAPTSDAFEGVDSFSYSITDGRGAVTTATVTIKADHPVSRELAASGAPVPGIPGATWTRFGVPSIFAAGESAGFLGTFRQGATSFTGIFSGPLGAPVLRVRTGFAARDAAGQTIRGTTFTRFQQPVFVGQSLAFMADVGGASITPANGTGIWLFTDDVLRSLARQGALAPGTTGARFARLITLAMPNADALFFTAQLKPGVGGVAPENDLGLWGWQAGAGVQLLLREGEVLDFGSGPRALRGFKVLAPAAGSQGHARYDSSEATVDALLTFHDSTTTAVTINAAGAFRIVAATREADQAGNIPLALGLPASPGNGELPAALATLRQQTSSAPGYSAIVDFSGEAILAKGATPAAGTGGAIFRSFQNPVAGLGLDGARQVAFQAVLANSGTAANAGLWSNHGAGGNLELVARKGNEPPGAAGTMFARFESLSLLPGRGPVFTAQLRSGATRVSTTTDQGCWATASDGLLRQIFREGDVVNGKTLRAFTLLSLVPGSAGQRRAWAAGDATPGLIYRAHYSDGTQAIVTVAVP